ncbi:MAG: tetratricopeptide repeat protein [Bacillota bacterium]|nr:tetratricopeptide repeat protein [Candidatus Fermentithermobacillaceae bacterium]
MGLTLEARVARMVKRGRYAQAARMLAGKLGTPGRGYVARQNLMAVCQARMGRMDEAKLLLLQLELEHPGDPRVLNNLGNVALLEGNLRTAITLYKEAARLSPWAEEPRFNMCLAYRKLGEAESSLSSYHEYALVKRMNLFSKALAVAGLATAAAALLYAWLSPA